MRMTLPAELRDLPQPLFLFDGVCHLCNGAVRFTLRHERAPTMNFAPVQSPSGQRVLTLLGLSTSDYDTMILVDHGQVVGKSDAMFCLARYLKAPWRWTACLSILPRRPLDWLYDRLAGNRYRLFGRRTECMMPPEGYRSRFLEQ